MGPGVCILFSLASPLSGNQLKQLAYVHYNSIVGLSRHFIPLAIEQRSTGGDDA